MVNHAPYCLFDDARPDGAGACLFEAPTEVLVAWRHDEVRGVLADARTALAAGHHVAGYLAYEAGHALDPALARCARKGAGPLAWFGLFGPPRRLSFAGVGEWLKSEDIARITAPRPRVDRTAYLSAAEWVRDGLFAGDFYQANLTFQNDLEAAGDARALYRLLRARGKAAWGGIVATGERDIISLSPEQFFRIEGRVLSTKPMKGTSPRGRDAGEDRALAEQLAADPKQRAENLMIVDLLRNDMARVSKAGSVEMTRLFAVETYPTVHQMVSEIRSALAPGRDAIDVIEHLFPCGSVTGAPKIAAIEALAALEPEARGAYTGSMGWLSPEGDAAFNVMIRTIERVAGNPHARLGLGSGLVVDSIPAHEWDECRLKGKFVADAACSFDLIETMGYCPNDGIVALEPHLERLREAASALGFAYNRHDARNELQAATFSHRRPALVRLLLARSGAMAIEVRPLEAAPTEPVAVKLVPLAIDPGDFRLAYKTTDRAFYDAPREAAGTFDVVFERADGSITEGSRTSVFVEREGVLVTPPRSMGLMPGVLRQSLIDEGRAVEGRLTREDLAEGFWIGNSARGLLAAVLAD